MKKYILTLLSLFFISIYSNFAFAEEAQVRSFIEGVSDKALNLIKNKTLSEQEKYNNLSKLFEESVDTDWMARFTIASHWREFSPEQKTKYLSIYKNFLVDTYIPKFKSYNDQKIVIEKVVSRDKGVYVVRTSIVSKDGTSYKVDYYIRETKAPLPEKFQLGGRPTAYGYTHKIFDIVAEGISLITTERADFSSAISQGGIDSFLSRLQDRNIKQSGTASHSFKTTD